MTEDQAIIATLILLGLYLVTAAYWIVTGNDSQKNAALACSVGALVYFGLEELIYPDEFTKLSSIWFHAAMTGICLAWSYAVATFSNAVHTSISIVPLAILNIMMIFNYQIYGTAITGMVASFSYFAIGMHLTILIIANYTNGIALNSSSVKHAHNVDMETL
jgi:hypothetical protein